MLKHFGTMALGISLLQGVAASSVEAAAVLDSSYTFQVNANTGTAVMHDLEFRMTGGYAEDSDNGWAVTTSFYNNQPGGTAGSNADTLTASYTAPNGLTPYLSDSLFFGIIQGLPQDIADNNADQKHLALFLDPTSAQNMKNIAFGTIFPTTNEDQLIFAIEQVHRDDLSDAQKVPYYEDQIYPFYDAARTAHAGSGGLERSIYFDASGPFAIMFFSDGTLVGDGTNSYTVTPEPLAPAAIGCLGALLKRHRRR